jgi:hypothetical protein
VLYVSSALSAVRGGAAQPLSVGARRQDAMPPLGMKVKELIEDSRER